MVGNSLRKAVLKPWLIPLLPITMAYSIRHRKTIEIEPYLPEHEMIIIDMEMIRRAESEVMMEVIAAQHPSALVMCIGPSHTNQGTIPLLTPALEQDKRQVGVLTSKRKSCTWFEPGAKGALGRREIPSFGDPPSHQQHRSHCINSMACDAR